MVRVIITTPLDDDQISHHPSKFITYFGALKITPALLVEVK
jgi:hypothetical protein